MQQGLQTDATCNMLLMSLNRGETALRDYYWLNDMTVANTWGTSQAVGWCMYPPLTTMLGVADQQCCVRLHDSWITFSVILLSSLIRRQLLL